VPALADLRDPFAAPAGAFEAAERGLDPATYGLMPEPSARLQNLEALYTLLDNSPLLGRVLRRYRAFRSAKRGNA
jgi:hypothetical protein